MKLQWAPVGVRISIAFTVCFAATIERYVFDGAVPDDALKCCDLDTLRVKESIEKVAQSS